MLATQQVIETEAAAYLVRQWLACSLYDRISTRPFITEMEKLWISYQIIYALHATHERNIAHGDLKCENVLVTSSLAVYVTDFASSFKPTYLPLDDPTDFSLFFDTSGRRTCYIAPERFYDSVAELPRPHPPRTRIDEVENVSEVLTYEPYLEILGLGRPNGRITEAMDVFSLGCVLAELWRDGAPLFTLSQLFRYRRGELDLDPMLSQIQHGGIRDVVRRMLHLDPTQRPSLHAILHQEPGLFPDAFSGYLHLYLVDLQRPTYHDKDALIQSDIQSSERDLTKDHLARLLKADDLIEKLYDDWATMVQFFHQANHLPGKDVFLGVCIPGVMLEPYVARQSDGKDPKASIPLSILLANMRHCQRPSSRCHAIELISHLVWGWLSDEAILDRVLPYLVTMLEDDSAKVRVCAMHGVAVALECIHEIPPANDGIWTEFFLPHLSYLSNDSSACVRTNSVFCVVRLAKSMLRLCNSASNASFDEDMRTLQEYAQEQLHRLVADVSTQVRRAVLVSAPELFPLLGHERLPGILSHVLTYLNEDDAELRATFFQTMSRLVPVLGAHWVQKYIHPLLLRSLSDSHDRVLVQLLQYIQISMNSSNRRDTLEALPYIATFLCHPNSWVREAAVGVLAHAAENFSITEKWMHVYLFLRPFLRCDLDTITALAMWNNLETPLPSGVLDACLSSLTSGRHSAFVRFWRAHAWHLDMDASTLQEWTRKNMDTLVRPPFVPCPKIGPLSREEQEMLQDLRQQGLELRNDFYKVAALWWYMERTSHKSKSSGAPPCTTLQGLSQHTIFFTARPCTTQILSQESIHMAATHLERNKCASSGPWRKSVKQDIMYPVRSDRSSAEVDTNTLATDKSDTASLSDSSIKLPWFGVPSVASASTSLLHVYAERTHHPRAETFTAPTSQRAGDQLSAVHHTFEGADPYVHAHLATVLGQIPAEGLTNVPPQPYDAPMRVMPATNPRPQGALVACYEEHSDRVTALAVSQDQAFFASGSLDGSVKVWDTARLEKNVTTHSRLTYTSHRAPITAVLVLHGTHCLVSAAQDGSIHAWGLALHTNVSLPQYSRPHVLGRKRLEANEHVVCMAQLVQGASPTVLLGTNKGRLIWWDVRSMRPTHSVSQFASSGSITCLAIDRDAHWACTGSSRGMVCLWDLRFSVLVRRWSVAEGPVPIHACLLHPRLRNSVILAWGPHGMATLDLESGSLTQVWHVTMDGRDKDAEILDAPLFKERSVIHDGEPMGCAMEWNSDPGQTSSSVEALVARVDGYSSTAHPSGAPTGYAITAGSDRVFRFWDLGSAEKSVAWGREVHGEFSLQNAQPCHYTYSGSANERLPTRSPLCMHEQSNFTNAFVKSHKDVITCLALLEAPFRCIVAGDRVGALRVWE